MANASSPGPIALSPSGPREVVDEEKADLIVAAWREQVNERRTILTEAGVDDDNLVVCDRISLAGKSYTAGGAAKIAAFLTESIGGDNDGSDTPAGEKDDDDDDDDARRSRSLASQITVADLSDMIASRPEDEGLQVLQTICDAFSNAKLIEVDLSDNALGSKGLARCRSVIDCQTGSLERLSICNAGLATESMDELATILTGGVPGGDDDANDSGCAAERLTKIHFYNNMSGIGGCHAFARILARCTSALVDLRFSSTRAQREGSQIIANALGAMTAEGNAVNLQRLDFADNTFGSEGAEQLSRALSQLHQLRRLNLSECSLEDEGTKFVCHAVFGSDACLEQLDLSGNEITRTGAGTIADLVEDSKLSLKVLKAEDNEMTSYGVKSIAAAFYSGDGGAPSNVECIKLGFNQVGTIGAIALVDAYGPGGENMPQLREIYIDGNTFNEDVMSQLEKAFGDRLQPMEDNDDEEDADDDLEDEDEDDGIEDEEDAAAREESADVNELADAVGEVSIDGLV